MPLMSSVSGLFWHNAAADTAAKAAHLKRTADLNQCFEEASAAVVSQRDAAAKLFAFHDGVVRQAGADEGTAAGSAGGLSLGGPGVVEFVRDLGGVQVQPCAQPLLEFDDCLMGPRLSVGAGCKNFSRLRHGSRHSRLCQWWKYILNLWRKQGGLCQPIQPRWILRLCPCVIGNSIPSSWVHESEYPALKLCRPALGKQVTVFLHAVKELFKRTQSEHTIVQDKALAVIGISKLVPAFSICPTTIDAQASRLKSVIGSDKYDLVVKRPYSPPVNVFRSCPLPVVNPQVVWNLYCQRHRQRRR